MEKRKLSQNNELRNILSKDFQINNSKSYSNNKLFLSNIFNKLQKSFTSADSLTQK
jgi:hypothetical protein